jgi:transcriptional regulator GlxA family with amidase domain
MAIIARASGPTVAQLVSRYLVVDERPSQSRYMIARHLQVDDRSLRLLERFVMANLDRVLTIADLAKASGTSPRTLARKLTETLNTTPRHFVQRLKVERAVHLLETTDHAVEQIAEQVGYADPAAFRRVLRRETGRSPRELRRVH